MLPNWQSKDRQSERMITDSPSIPEPPMGDENLEKESSDQLSLNQDDETKDYPNIPNWEKKESPEGKKESKTKEGFTPQLTQDSSNLSPGIQDSPKNSIDHSEKKTTPQTTEPKKKTIYKAPIQQSPSKLTTKTAPKKQATSTKSTKKATSSKQNRVAKKNNVSKTPSRSSYKPSRPVERKATSAEKTATVDQRIKKLETKLNVHMQDTNSRLNSLEQRVERLEQKLSAPR